MSEKYPEYLHGDPRPADMRVCNVVVCMRCKEEFLLGQTVNGESTYKKHHITIRKNPTLIPR